MLYIGIDPGEVWCGFAALNIIASGSTYAVAEARTYSVEKRGGYLKMVRDILNLLPHQRPTLIIAEDFRIRHAGHQRFNHGDTLRFLGALEYGASNIGQFEFALVPPNDNAKRETRELFGPIIRTYSRQWPKPGHAAWNHCLSAWRVLGQHLLSHNVTVLTEIQQLRRSKKSSRWLPVSERPFINPHEHIAPPVKWM